MEMDIRIVKHSIEMFKFLEIKRKHHNMAIRGI
jgi:hypothetical protein